MLENPGKELRKLLSAPGILMAPGVYDGISARLAEAAGFKVVYRTGGGTAASLIGQPDIGLLTMTEMVNHAANIAACINLPVIADADTGYGNSLNVIRTVHEFERAGVAAIHLEDQVFPKRCGHLSGKAVIPAEEFVGKIRAAVNERFNPDFIIIARTDARLPEGVDKAIDRCKRYIEAGADVIFFEAHQSIDEVEKVAQELADQAPLLINMSGGNNINIRDLEQMGYKIVIFPGACMFPAIIKMKEALSYLKANGTDQGIVDESFSPMDLFKTVGIEKWLELENKYKP